MSLVAENKEEYNIFDDFPLKQEQIECVDFALEHQNLVCNAQVGCGKTRIGITFAHRIMKRNKDVVTFILAPKIANTVWKKELQHAGLHYSIITTDDTRLDNASRFFIFNYSSMEGMGKDKHYSMVNLLQNLRDRGIRVILVADEAHLVGSEDSGQAKLLRALRPQFACVCGLTGTPLLNDISGLYHTVDFVKPGFFGSWYDFKNNYVIVEKKQIRLSGGRRRTVEELKGYKNLDYLKERLKEVVVTRSRSYNIKYEFRKCTMNDYERDMYDTAAKGLLEDSLNEKVFSARLWDLQRVCDGSASQMASDELYCKHKLLINTVREIVQRGEGTIIYCELEDSYTTVYNLMKQYKGYIGFRNLWMITGKVDYSDRVKCEKALQAKDIVIITKAGNKAINLQAINNVVYLDTPFAVGDVIQTNGRIARTDTKYPEMHVYFLEVDDTIDTYKRILLSDHLDLVKELFGGSSVMPVYETKVNLDKYKQYFKNRLLWKRC